MGAERGRNRTSNVKRIIIMSTEDYKHKISYLEAQIDSLSSKLKNLPVASMGQDEGAPNGLPILGGSGMPWRKIALGYKINPDGDDPDEVRIYAGEIDRVAVAQTDVTVADGDYVYVRRTLADDTMLVTNAASVPANTSTYRYYRLYKFSVSDGVASISNIYRPFDIDGTVLNVDGLSGSQYQVLQLNADGDVVIDWLRAGGAL